MPGGKSLTPCGLWAKPQGAVPTSQRQQGKRKQSRAGNKGRAIICEYMIKLTLLLLWLALFIGPCSPLPRLKECVCPHACTHQALMRPPAVSLGLASRQVLAYLPLHSLSTIVSNQFRKQLRGQLEKITRKNYIITVCLDLRRYQ